MLVLQKGILFQFENNSEHVASFYGLTLFNVLLTNNIEPKNSYIMYQSNINDTKNYNSIDEYLNEANSKV